MPLATFAALKPAARWLPLSWGFRLADLVGWVLYLSPPGRRRRGAMQAAFPDGPRGAGELARRWLTGPYRDYLYLRRVVTGRDDLPTAADVRSEMSEATRSLLEGDQSLIVATGHFARQPMLGLYTEGVVPRRPIAVVAQLPERPSSTAEARTIEHFGQMLAVMGLARPEIRVVPIGTLTGAREVVQRLSEPGWAAMISADATVANWMPMALARPFAGWAQRPFANGTAQFARMAQVPVVVAIPYLDADGACVVEWSDPLPPPGRRDRAGEATLTDQILDRLELAVGHRPAQYVIDVGEGRQWDPTNERWLSTLS
ncbi:MAG: hypothetical protein JJE52_06900 [Acidimicrobiia bacterium]|nr:hypothetical protein [Acidimicrobiia bacterium]